MVKNLPAMQETWIQFLGPENPLQKKIGFPLQYSFLPGESHEQRNLRLVARSCLTLCDPMDYSPSGSSVYGDSPGRNTRVGCHALLQGIFPTQGSNPGLPHWRRTLCHLTHQGSPWGHKELDTTQ